jgi:hypothetical protein
MLSLDSDLRLIEEWKDQRKEMLVKKTCIRHVSLHRAMMMDVQGQAKDLLHHGMEQIPHLANSGLACAVDN